MYIYVFGCTCMYVYMYVSLHVCMHVCLYVCMHVLDQLIILYICLKNNSRKGRYSKILNYLCQSYHCSYFLCYLFYTTLINDKFVHQIMNNEKPMYLNNGVYIYMFACMHVYTCRCIHVCMHECMQLCTKVNMHTPM